MSVNYSFYMGKKGHIPLSSFFVTFQHPQGNSFVISWDDLGGVNQSTWLQTVASSEIISSSLLPGPVRKAHQGPKRLLFLLISPATYQGSDEHRRLQTCIQVGRTGFKIGYHRERSHLKADLHSDKWIKIGGFSFIKWGGYWDLNLQNFDIQASEVQIKELIYIISETVFLSSVICKITLMSFPFKITWPFSLLGF